MPGLKNCQDCGGRIPVDAPLGICPACLVVGAVDFEAGSGLVFDSSERVDGYEILRKIGEGGFAEVFEADQLGPVERRVALKILKREIASPQVLARFEAERQVLAKMEHPNIATVFSAGETRDGEPYVAMEMVSGRPLTQYCQEEILDLREKLALFKKVCDAVHHAHLKGIIHRDLKPSNVLVANRDGEAVPKVIDFGIARIFDESRSDYEGVTCAHQLVGTPGYMSPEQASLDAGGVDARSDIYSLGVLLYETLAGKAPFPSREDGNGSVLELLRRVREEEPIRLSSHSRSLRGEVEWITKKAMEKNPEDRYESASALGGDIGRILRNEAVSAGSPPAFYFLRMFVKRHLTAVLASVVALCALLGGLIVSSLQYTKATRLGVALTTREQELRASFRDSDYRMALQFHERRRVGDAIAYLCRALRTQPDDYSSASCLLSILAHDRFYFSSYPGLEYPPEVETAEFPFLATDSATGLFVGSDANSQGLFRADFSGNRIERFPVELKESVQFLLAADERDHFFISDGNVLALRHLSQPSITLREFAVNSRISCIASDPASQVVAAGTEEGEILVWKTNDSSAPVTLMVGQAPVTALCFGREGGMLAYGNDVGFVGTWELQSGRHLWNTVAHDAGISAITIGAAGFPVASGDRQGIVQFFQGSGMISSLSPMHHSGEVRVLSLKPGGLKLFSGDADGGARIWDTRSGRLAAMAGVSEGALSFVGRIRIGGQLIVAEEEGSVRVISPDSGQGESFPGAGQARAVGLDVEGGQLLVLSDRRQDIKQFDLSRFSAHSPRFELVSIREEVGESGESNFEFEQSSPFEITVGMNGKTVRSLRFSQAVTTAALSPRGDRLAVLFGGDSIQLWKVKTGEALTPKHSLVKKATAVSFDRNEERLVLVHEGGERTLWNIPPAEVTLSPGFLAFCERIGGKKLDAGSSIRTVTRNPPFEELAEISLFAKGEMEERYVRWLLDDSPSRFLAPGICLSLFEYVEKLLELGSAEAIREAILLDPGNPEVIARVKAGILRGSTAAPVP